MKRIITTSIILLAAVSIMAVTGRKQQYFPDGRDIVCQDGDKRYNRALYGSYTEYRLETSDRPIFAVYRSKAHKNIRFRLTANGKTTPLEQTTHAEARYNAGKRVYKLTDASWGKGSLTITVLLQPDAESAIWKFEPQSMPANAKVEMVVCDIKRPKFNRSGDMNSDPADSFEPADGDPNKQTVQWSLGTETTYAVLDCKGGAYRNANPQATYTVLESGASTYTLSTPTGAEAERLYAKAWQHHEWLAGNIIFDTPDPYLNTMGGTLMAAADGAWDGEVWLHGAIVWRMQLNGWRAGFLGDLLGLPDRAVSHFNAYANSQITDVEPIIPNPTPDPEKLLTREVAIPTARTSCTTTT